MPKWVVLSFLARVFLAVLSGIAAVPAAAEEGPVLARGVNIANWLQLDGRQVITARDMATIREAGFDHVRLAVDPAFLGWTPASLLSADPVPRIALLDAAVATVLEAGLALVLDLHLADTTKQEVEVSADAEDAVVALWRFLARRYAEHPPSVIAFDLYNEPQYYRRPAQWPGFAARMVEAVRAVAPHHVLILSGAQGGDVAGLIRMRPLPDPQIRYAFHFYLPYIFTHQGANWLPGATEIPRMRHVPYPALMARGPVELEDGADRVLADQEFRRYLLEDWNRARIDEQIQPAWRWGRSHGVAVLCTEFGVYRRNADAASRTLWLGDVAMTLTGRGIGWTVWDYGDAFGIVRVVGPALVAGDGAVLPDPASSSSRREIDPDAAAALGLVPVLP